MIESYYWKQDLLAHASRLTPVQRPGRWSERAVVNFEKELMISFFMIRALLERGKVSSRSRNYQVPLGRSPWNGKQITVLNHWLIGDLYRWENEEASHVSIAFLSNQFVHSRAIFTMRDKTRNWSEVLLCSDFEARKAIYRVSVQEIQKVFRLVGSDYVRRSSLVYDEELRDYRITTD
jgi:hypothetical protein